MFFFSNQILCSFCTTYTYLISENWPQRITEWQMIDPNSFLSATNYCNDKRIFDQMGGYDNIKQDIYILLLHGRAMYDYKSVSFVHFRNQTLLGIFLWHDIFFWFRLHLVDFFRYSKTKHKSGSLLSLLRLNEPNRLLFWYSWISSYNRSRSCLHFVYKGGLNV